MSADASRNLPHFLTQDTNDTDSLHSPLPTTAYNVTTQQRNEDLAKIEIAVQAIIFTLAVISNSLVLIILLCVRRKKLNRVYLMMTHLTCADLFVAFFNVLPQLTEDILGHFFGGNFLCKFVKYFQVVAMFASSYVLVSTAIDRYLAICHPLTAKMWSKSKMHCIVAIAWGFSLLFSTPQLIIFSHAERMPGIPECIATFDPQWTLQLYITSITVAIYIIPALLLTCAYGRICFSVWSSMRVRERQLLGGSRSHQKCSLSNQSERCSSGENGELLSRSLRGTNDMMLSQRYPVVPSKGISSTKGSSKSKVKTVKLTLTVIVCYLLCWGPFFVTQMWGAWDPNFPSERPEMVIIFLLASLNSCTNPWIYLFFVDNICSKMKGLTFSARRRSFAPVSSAHYRK